MCIRDRHCLDRYSLGPGSSRQRAASQLDCLTAMTVLVQRNLLKNGLIIVVMIPLARLVSEQLLWGWPTVGPRADRKFRSSITKGTTFCPDTASLYFHLFSVSVFFHCVPPRDRIPTISTLPSLNCRSYTQRHDRKGRVRQENNVGSIHLVKDNLSELAQKCVSKIWGYPVWL